ncbi:MAG: hypothetical protein RLP44_05555 [Aggregatilineales bacterium]
MNDNESNQSEPKFRPHENPCDICDSSDFYWGEMLTGESGNRTLKLWFRPSHFAPDDGDYVTEARLCRDCGNIKLFGFIP